MTENSRAGLARNLIQAMAFVVVVSLLTSCSTVRGWRGGSDDSSAAIQQGEALDVEATAAERETELLDLVEQHMAEVEADSSSNQSRIVRKKPYYFKEYSNYVSEPSSERIVMTETESRTAPYVADVKLDKVRYATRLHRSREEARTDSSFLRDTGVETLSYELRNGRWTRVGSFFLAEQTEEQVGGEWVTVERRLQRTAVAEEPEKGWFSRTWSQVTGRE